MTNTIPNVPRELLERAWRALANSATGREIGAYLDADPCTPECAETCARASMCATCSADLSAPSPAGVAGLVAVKVWEADADWDDHELVVRLSAAQTIIDGLRGENERIRLNIAEYNEAISCYQSERDQHAQRIGELEGLLREVHDTYRSAIHWEDLRGTMKRIEAALYAGKDSDQ